MRGRAAFCIALAGLVLVAALALPAAASTHSSKKPTAAVKSQWRVFPGPKVDQGVPLLGVAWAANRVWVIAPHGEVATVGSARVSAGTLGSFAATRLPGGGQQYVPIVDGELIFARDDGFDTASLLADGRLGALKPIADDLLTRAKEAAPKLEGVTIENGVRLEDRRVWALRGWEPGRAAKGFFLVCCSESGAAADLTRFIDRQIGAFSPQLGLDSRGRVWLAWLDRRDYSRAIRGVPRIVELDGSTLAPRTTPVAPPGLVADKVALACATSCRIVAQSAAGDIVSWAPGERSPTLVVRRAVRKVGYTMVFPRELLAASYRAGRLAVAYRGQTATRSARDVVRVVRGDARGARSRVLGTVATTFGWPPGKLVPTFMDSVVYGVFVPGGLVALEHFRQGNASSPVIYTLVRLGR